MKKVKKVTNGSVEPQGGPWEGSVTERLGGRGQRLLNIRSPVGQRERRPQRRGTAELSAGASATRRPSFSLFLDTWCALVTGSCAFSFRWE